MRCLVGWFGWRLVAGRFDVVFVSLLSGWLVLL